MLTNLGLPGILVLLISLYFLYLPIPMARRRGRNPFLWFLWGLLFSPIIALPVLVILGDRR